MAPGDLQSDLDPLQVAELQRAAARAEDLAAELRDFLDNAVEGMHQVGPDGVIMWANRAELEMLGYLREEYVGHPIREFHAEPEVADDLLARLSRGEAIHNRQAVMHARDGSHKFVLISSSGVFRQGKLVASRCFTREITHERDAYIAQARLAAIVDGSEDAIVSKDLDGTVRSWNRGAHRLFGYSAEEMIGASILRVIPPDRHDEERRILARIAAGERIEHYETVRQHRDGRLVHVSLTVSPLKDFFGRIIGASKIARDIGPQLEAERKKDHFLAVLAHELRNPLAPIRNTLSLMRSDTLPAEQRERAMVMAERQMAQLTRLLDDLLDVTRITTGRVELKRERLDLNILVRQAVEAVRPHIESRRHELVARITAAPLWIDADAVRISQVVSNLLANAAKYTDPGGRVELSVERDGNSAWVRVADNGIGFTPAMRQRLFVLFEQEDDVGVRAAGGLGIGLALVREFVERHGGSVEAASPGRGRGSVFSVRLPLVD